MAQQKERRPFIFPAGEFFAAGNMTFSTTEKDEETKKSEKPIVMVSPMWQDWFGEAAVSVSSPITSMVSDSVVEGGEHHISKMSSARNMTDRKPTIGSDAAIAVPQPRIERAGTLRRTDSISGLIYHPSSSYVVSGSLNENFASDRYNERDNSFYSNSLSRVDLQTEEIRNPEEGTSTNTRRMVLPREQSSEAVPRLEMTAQTGDVDFAVRRDGEDVTHAAAREDVLYVNEVLTRARAQKGGELTVDETKQLRRLAALQRWTYNRDGNSCDNGERWAYQADRLPLRRNFSGSETPSGVERINRTIVSYARQQSEQLNRIVDLLDVLRD